MQQELRSSHYIRQPTFMEQEPEPSQRLKKKTREFMFHEHKVPNKVYKIKEIQILLH